jgi:hypothetical protein
VSTGKIRLFLEVFIFNQKIHTADRTLTTLTPRY